MADAVYYILLTTALLAAFGSGWATGTINEKGRNRAK